MVDEDDVDVDVDGDDVDVDVDGDNDGDDVVDNGDRQHEKCCARRGGDQRCLMRRAALSTRCDQEF